MKDTANLFRGNKTRKIYEWQRSLSGFLARRKWRVRIQSESNPVMQTMLTYIAILHKDNHVTCVVILSAAKIGCTISTFTELGRDRLLCVEVTLDGDWLFHQSSSFSNNPPLFQHKLLISSYGKIWILRARPEMNYYLARSCGRPRPWENLP